MLSKNRVRQYQNTVITQRTGFPTSKSWEKFALFRHTTVRWHYGMQLKKKFSFRLVFQTLKFSLKLIKKFVTNVIDCMRSGLIESGPVEVLFVFTIERRRS